MIRSGIYVYIYIYSVIHQVFPNKVGSGIPKTKLVFFFFFVAVLLQLQKIRRKKFVYDFFCRKKFFGVKKSKIANRLKRVLPKFRADRSYVWEVNGRWKFVIAARRKSQKYLFPNLLRTPFITVEKGKEARGDL